MGSAEEMHAAMVNRSIRTIKAELEYLCDASVISPQTLSELLSKVPAQTALHAPISVGAVPSAVNGPVSHAPTPVPNASMNNLSLNNHNQPQANSNGYYDEKAQHEQAPPAYNAPPPVANYPPLAQATALYPYNSTDAGDLELQPNDHITVTEYMNAEWWKGRSSRTGQEGIFPRSYVKVVEEKAAASSTTNNYGNMPLEISGQGNGEGKVPGKAEQQGKKFGKKLGNAAIFGAGATIGGNIVNSIF
ncbi:unnamed protein product [Zymoseptoria tritici ST99CH_1A5]|uniref:SH3 domain-containing protein n=4 Tax=Zymoseptoria tritici TaxID=1047171 RepID=A0A1X7RD53_ZYMT9|nr:unnamed protein product [Zymoseptoria tritici ST99CH_3D7]SMR41674.1 unnamed protein product [Zymoseptoria tritici ST99CH_1E4]SMR43864.1 unnamed protein product [Zymoseptoria tritici ST99CH_3D1]SMY19024.1 unnamed protein product [Zymoseptoria tritici ST99CH_1A5]